MTLPETDHSSEFTDHHGPTVDQLGGFDVIDCGACGFRHVVPLPTPAELEAIYSEEYYSDEKPTYLAHAAEDAEWAALGYADRLTRLEQVLGTRGRLLDVGSGPGFFLKAASDKGWRVTGIEPSRQAAEFATNMGLEITNNFFSDETASTLGKFDAVVMTNMLEHVPDPIGLVMLARKVLKPFGAICLTAPNDYNGFQKALRDNAGVSPWWLAPPHHLNYFDFSSLERLVTRCGFQLRGRFTSFPMEMFALQGDLYVGDDVLGRALHKKRKVFDQTLAGNAETRTAFYDALAQAGLGREAIVFAQKGP